MTGSRIQGLSWQEAFTVYTKPRVIGMLFLGFAAGLPFLLVFSTLSAWLTESGISRATIGFFSWVGITYSIKFFWAPVIDRLPLPILIALCCTRSKLGYPVALQALSIATHSAVVFKLIKTCPRRYSSDICHLFSRNIS